MRSYEFGGFRLDGFRRQLRDTDGKLLELPARSIDALLVLLERRGEDVSKEQLMRALWPNTIVEENDLNQAVFALRRALGEDFNSPRFITTLPGRGYRFIAKLEPAIPTALTQTSRSWPPSYLAFAVAVLITLGVAAGFWQSGNAENAEPVTVAVLPFTALLPEQGDPALELGMTDTLISHLGGVPAVIVTSLNTVRSVAGAHADATDAGKALGVEAVLESSILRQGERVRVLSRLIRVSDGKSLWVGEFDEPISDILAVQDFIAESVMLTLAP